MAAEQAAGRTDWRQVRKIGEGDAGIVYLIQKGVGGELAILKRPSSNVLDAQRQAPQIAKEAKILELLQAYPNLTAGLKLRTTRLLDRVGPEGSEQFFIVIERAPGFSLPTLARVAKFGLDEAQLDRRELRPAEKLFLEILEEKKQVPERVILLALQSLLDFLPRLHKQLFRIETWRKAGLIWNDVKPDHLFWDLYTQEFSIIDWGNSEFLEAGGVTADRRYSDAEDDRQFVEEMGKFLTQTSPSLAAELDWPTSIQDLPRLRSALASAVHSRNSAVEKARHHEASLLQTTQFNSNLFSKLRQAQKDILELGALPDYARAEALCRRLATTLISQDDLAHFDRLAGWAIELPDANSTYWRLMAYLVGVARQSPYGEQFRPALQAALQENWADALWLLRSMAPEGAEWWDESSRRLRQVITGLDPKAETPLQMLYRLRAGLENRPQYAALVGELNPILARWSLMDPAPPFSGLEYKDVEQNFLRQLHPVERQEVVEALAQVRIQVHNILTAWNQRDFETARKGLRTLLAWDPDRIRLLAIDEAIASAHRWITRLTAENRIPEQPEQYAVSFYVQGQDLENQVGLAPAWLGPRLDLLRCFRSGEKPHRVLNAHSDLLKEIPWAKDYYERVPSPDVDQRQVNLPSFYSLLRKWHWGEAEELLDHEAMLPYRDTYVNLIETLKAARIGEYKLDPRARYAPEDQEYPEAQTVASRIVQWRLAIRQDGIARAGEVLKQPINAGEWTLLNNALNYQMDLETELVRIKCYMQSQWDLAASRDDQEPIYAGYASTAKLLNQASQSWIPQSRIERPIERLELIESRLQQALEAYQQWQTEHKSKARDFIDILKADAADWRMVEQKISSLISLTGKLKKESQNWPPHSDPGYHEEVVQRARRYLDEIRTFENELTGKTFHAATWLDTFLQITGVKKYVGERHQVLTNQMSHPLYEWLSEYPDPKRKTMRSWFS